MRERFNRSRLKLRTLMKRRSLVLAKDIAPLPTTPDRVRLPELSRRTREGVSTLATKLLDTTQQRKPAKSILMMGAHAIKLGMAPYINDLIRRGYFTHVAVNGAALVHEFELACYGATSEDVKQELTHGFFGLWYETGLLNEAVNQSHSEWGGLGDSLRGFFDGFTVSHYESVIGMCHALNVPYTVHAAIGTDINHMQPNFDPAKWGQATYNDFLSFADSVSQLEHGGVFTCMGSATIGPEIFQKALSMARNVGPCRGFHTCVIDKVPLPENWREIGEPTKDNPLYFYRPWKTILSRSVDISRDGANSTYIEGDIEHVIPALWAELVRRSKN